MTSHEILVSKITRIGLPSEEKRKNRFPIPKTDRNGSSLETLSSRLSSQESSKTVRNLNGFRGNRSSSERSLHSSGSFEPKALDRPFRSDTTKYKDPICKRNENLIRSRKNSSKASNSQAQHRRDDLLSPFASLLDHLASIEESIVFLRKLQKKAYPSTQDIESHMTRVSRAFLCSSKSIFQIRDTCSSMLQDMNIYARSIKQPHITKRSEGERKRIA